MKKLKQWIYICSSPEPMADSEFIVERDFRRSFTPPFLVRLSFVVCQQFQTTSPLKLRSQFFSYCTYSIYRWLRNLVPIATYSFHRLIMGKVKIDNFYCLVGDI